MAFFPSISEKQVAEQLAMLLNQNNGLSSIKSVRGILTGRTEYVVETHGNLLLAACGVERQSYTLTEIKHLVVRPQWRGKGIGCFLVEKAAERATTPILYATVREDNLPSVAVFRTAGFKVAGQYRSSQHRVLLLTKESGRWQANAASSSASNLEPPPIPLPTWFEKFNE